MAGMFLSFSEFCLRSEFIITRDYCIVKQKPKKHDKENTTCTYHYVAVTANVIVTAHFRLTLVTGRTDEWTDVVRDGTGY